LIEPIFKVSPENFVHWELSRCFPDRAKASNKPRNSIGGLHRLIAMTFNLIWWLYQAASRLGGVIHRHGDFCDQCISLIMLIKYQNEILKRITIFFTMLVEAFDCLSQYDAIKLVWIMFF